MMLIRAEVTWQRDEETGEWKITPAEKIHNQRSAVSRWATVAERGMVLTRAPGENPSLNFAEKNALSN
jgi:hypothetical protein